LAVAVALPPRFRNERLSPPLEAAGLAADELGELLPGLLPKADEDEPPDEAGFLSSSLRPGSLLVKPPRREAKPPPDSPFGAAGFEPGELPPLSAPLPMGKREVSALRPPPDF
jgi:hypothetical protein